VIGKCRFIDLPRVNDPRGNLTFVESNFHIPFDIQRIYYLSDIPEGVERGGHAHKALHQLIIAMTGSFDIHLDDGFSKKTLHLSQNQAGLYLCPMMWREINNFSSDAVCMVLASEHYDEADYYRDYDDFLSDARRSAE